MLVVLAIFVLAVVVVIDVVVVVIDDVVVDRNSRSSNFRPKRLKKGKDLSLRVNKLIISTRRKKEMAFFFIKLVYLDEAKLPLGK